MADLQTNILHWISTVCCKSLEIFFFVNKRIVFAYIIGGKIKKRFFFSNFYLSSIKDHKIKKKFKWKKKSQKKNKRKKDTINLKKKTVQKFRNFYNLIFKMSAFGAITSQNSFWHRFNQLVYSAGIFDHSLSKTSFKCSTDVTFVFTILASVYDHKFSIKLRSVERVRHGRTWMFCSLNQSLT